MASLKRNFSWILSGSVVYAAANWGILSIFAHISTPEYLGFFAYGLAVSNPVFSLLSLNLRGLHASDAKGEFPISHLIAARNVTTAIALLVMLAIAAAASGPPTLKLTILLVAVGKAFDASIGLLLGYYQRRQTMKMLSFAQSANGILSLIFCWLLLFVSNGNPAFGALGYACGSAVSSRLFWMTAKRRERKLGRTKIFKPVLDRRTFAKVVAKGLPLGAAISVAAANTAILRHSLATGVGMHSLGVFSALSYALVPMSMTINALGQAALPRIADFRLKEPEKFLGRSAKLIGLAMLIGVAATILAFFFGDLFLLVFYGPEYADSSNLLFELSAAGIVTCGASVMTYILLGAGITRAQFLMSTVSLASTVIASAYLIPSLQISATPIIICLSSLSQIVIAIAALFIANRRQTFGTQGSSHSDRGAADITS